MKRQYQPFFFHHRERERGGERPCFYNVIVWSHFSGTPVFLPSTGTNLTPFTLSLGSDDPPHLRPTAGSHLITDHHSHLACVPFQLSAQFLSDDPRETLTHWPRLEPSNRSLIQPLPFLLIRPLPAQSDPHAR